MSRTPLTATSRACRRRLRGIGLALGWGAAGSLVGDGTLCCPQAVAGPTAQLRVMGTTSLALQAQSTPGKLTVSGKLEDDSGQGVAEAQVRLELAPPPDEEQNVSGCDDSSTLLSEQRSAAQAVVSVQTDPGGRFCVEVQGEVGIQRARASYRDPAGLYEGAETEAAVQAAHRSLRLRFESAPRRVDLAQPLYTLLVSAHALEPTVDGPQRARLELWLREAHQPPRRLDSISAPLGKTTRVKLDTETLGTPGAAMLEIRSAGSDRFHPASARTPLERVARVELSVSGDAEIADGKLQVGVGSVTGAVSRGSVEAQVGGRTIAMAPVRAGAAHLVVEPTAEQGDTAVVQLSYVPDSPWWLPGRPIEVLVPASQPFRWGLVLWPMAGLALVLWAATAYRRPVARPAARGPSGSRLVGHAGISVIKSGTGRGWTGVAADAHDGQTLKACRLQILPPGFETAPPRARATSDDQGRFRIDPLDAAPPEGTLLEVARAGYSTLRQPLPPQGEVVIAMATHRRAALDRLVGWARRRAGPYHRGSEPTPAQVATISERVDEPVVGAWATLVEQVAYGEQAPTDEDERRIAEAEPTR